MARRNTRLILTFIFVSIGINLLAMTLTDSLLYRKNFQEHVRAHITLIDEKMRLYAQELMALSRRFADVQVKCPLGRPYAVRTADCIGEDLGDIVTYRTAFVFNALPGGVFSVDHLRYSQRQLEIAEKHINALYKALEVNREIIPDQTFANAIAALDETAPFVPLATSFINMIQMLNIVLIPLLGFLLRGAVKAGDERWSEDSHPVPASAKAEVRNTAAAKAKVEHRLDPKVEAKVDADVVAAPTRRAAS